MVKKRKKPQDLPLQGNLFSRRAMLLASGKGLLLAAAATRLFQLSISSNEHFQKLSDRNRISTRLIMPSRGKIFDRKGNILATSTNCYRAVIIRDQAVNWQELLQRAKSVLELSDDDIMHITHEIRRKPKFIPVILKEDLTWDEVAFLEVNLPDLSGIFIEEGENRLYPNGEICSHILGYVARVSEKDLDGDPLLELPGFCIGKSGIEQSCDKVLRGIQGVKQVEVDARGRVERELSLKLPVQGPDKTLAIDLDLQESAMEILNAHKSGSAIILDVNTGGILAFASAPGFDPNPFVKGIDKQSWDQLLNHPYKALINKSIQGLYSPGSTFKMVVALAALKGGICTPNTHIHCPGHYMLGNHKFHCWAWKTGGHGAMDLSNAIKHSCDTYFYEIAHRMGMDPIVEMGQFFGLGEKIGIGLDGEKNGLIPSPAWKKRVHNKQWMGGETINASIGQGSVLTTPLQLVVMTARLATGKVVVPCFDMNESCAFEDLPVDPDHLALIQQSMARVMNEPGGTAYAYRIIGPGLEMAGKTGTSQVRHLSHKDRLSGAVKAWPWHWGDHAVFVGYAPIHKPRFAISVLVEHGGGGSKVASPIARDLLRMTQEIV